MLFDPYSYDLTTSAGQRRQPDAARGAQALLDVPQEARAALWHRLMDATEGALDLWEQTPPGVRREAQVSVQHAGLPRFHPDHLRAQTLPGWHRLMGIELRLAAQELETLILAESVVSWAKLAEQCARIGQLYNELKRRAGVGVALSIVRWELRLLRYRASSAVAPLIYD